MHKILKRVLSCMLISSMIAMSLSACSISNQHVEMIYGENNNNDLSYWDDAVNDSVTTWDDAYVVYWSDVDDYSDAVYSQILFDDVTSDFPVVECRVLDYQSNGQYFDGEKMYQLVNDKFDVNTFVSKYAVGTGVIVICVVLTIVTDGAATPFACFIAGAAEESITQAIKMAAFSAAINAIDTAFEGGNLEDMLYGAIEGSADGYAYGAIYGAITGGLNSKYCFTGDTLIDTLDGMIPISNIEIGNQVKSYNEYTSEYEYKSVSQIMKSVTDEIVTVTFGDETINSTAHHPYLTKNGWKSAYELMPGELVLANDGEYQEVLSVELCKLSEEIPVYNLCIEDNHTYVVGYTSAVVHNRCKPNEKYANDTYKFPEGSEQALKYPDGVPFNADGFPDFSKYAEKTVTFDPPSLEGKNAGTCLTGNCSSDFAMANKAAGFDKTPDGYTWHHCEDMRTMQLVPQDLHSVAYGGVAHAGGESMLRAFWEIAKMAM